MPLLAASILVTQHILLANLKPVDELGKSRTRSLITIGQHKEMFGSRARRAREIIKSQRGSTISGDRGAKIGVGTIVALIYTC
jgi:hypothetical protein